MLLSRMKVKDGRIVTKDMDIADYYEKYKGYLINGTTSDDFVVQRARKGTENNPIWENFLSRRFDTIAQAKNYIDVNFSRSKDSISEGAKIVVNTESHVNESAIAVTINESDCLVRFENGDEETVPIEAVSAFESMANDAEKCMKDAMGTVIVRKGGYSIVEGVGTDSGWFFVTGKGENEKFKTKSQAEEYMDNCIEEDNTQDQSPSETETKINELKQNMDVARARGYDTAPYQKEIDRLRSMDALSEMDKKMLSQGKYLKIILPPGMGEDLYTNNFTAAKEMAKEYGAGTKVVNLNENKDKYMNGMDSLNTKMKLSQPAAIEMIQKMYFGSQYSNDGRGSLIFSFNGQIVGQYDLETKILYYQFKNSSQDKYTGDPLTDKGKEIMAALKEQYGEEKGEQVFYAMKNSGQIEGID